MDLQLKGRIALITGPAKGMGAAISKAFAAEGCQLALIGRDTAAIREWLRENTPGIDSTVTITCPSCDTSFTVELPITESFFRPTQ